MAAPKAHVFWLRSFSPGLCGGEWPGRKSVVGFIRFFFIFFPLDLWATGKAPLRDTYFLDGRRSDHAAGSFPDFGGDEVVF